MFSFHLLDQADETWHFYLSYSVLSRLILWDSKIMKTEHVIIMETNIIKQISNTKIIGYCTITVAVLEKFLSLTDVLPEIFRLLVPSTRFLLFILVL